MASNTKPKDSATRIFFRENRVFAEIFNHLFFHGKAVIRPHLLHERDTGQINLLLDDEKETPQGENHFRDLLKMHLCKTDGGNTCLLLGIEGQSRACRSMPIRMLAYDAREYERQAREEAFRTGGMLTPVLSLVINLGEKPWDGPGSIGELYRPVSPEIRSLLEEYPMRVLDPHKLSEEEIAKFSNELQYVFRAVKCGKDKRKLHDTFFTNGQKILVKPSTVQCIAALLGVSADSIQNSKGGKINMCSAMAELKAEWEDEARKAGREEGRKAGREEGRKAGREEEKEKNLRSVVNACRKQNMCKENILLLLAQITGNASMDFEKYFPENQHA